MSITLEELRRAQKLNAPAVARVVADVYPAVHRMAHGLAGRTDAARAILRFVVRRGLRALPTWRDEGAPQRWFMHHTILAARRACRKKPAPMEDLLVRESSSAHAGYVAFVRALRALAVQQREAILLHHAEHLPLRQVSIAMDCSTEAAGAHLSAGVSALRHTAGEDFDRFITQLASTYATFTPRGDLVLPSIRKRVSRFVWPRKIWRILRPLLTIALLAAIGWAAWKIYHLIDV